MCQALGWKSTTDKNEPGYWYLHKGLNGMYHIDLNSKKKGFPYRPLIRYQVSGADICVLADIITGILRYLDGKLPGMEVERNINEGDSENDK